MKDRTHLSELYVALADNDEARIRTSLQRMGFKFRHGHPDIMVKYARFHFAKEWANQDVTMGMNPMFFMDWLNAQDPLVDLPKQYVVLIRMLLVLSGFQNAFGFPYSFSKIWEGPARDCLQSASSGLGVTSHAV
jgi:hypothetical protein